MTKKESPRVSRPCWQYCRWSNVSISDNYVSILPTKWIRT